MGVILIIGWKLCRYMQLLFSLRKSNTRLFMRKIIDLFFTILKEMQKDKLGAFAAQTAYFLLLSAIPFLILILYLIQYTAISEDTIIHIINISLPEYFASYVVSIVREMYIRQSSVVSFSIVAAIWSSAKGIQSLSNGLNSIHNTIENRNWLILRIRAMIYTLIFSVGFIFSIVIGMYGNTLRKQLFAQFDVTYKTLNFIVYFRHLILFMLLFLLFMLILLFLPNRKATVKSQVPVALATTISLELLTGLISLYVNHFGGKTVYGSMTTLMFICMWAYFGMYIFLFFTEVDSIYQKDIRKMWHRFQKERDKRIARIKERIIP